MKNSACFETFSTTADVGIRIRGTGFTEFYNCAVKGLNALYYNGHLPEEDDHPLEIIPYEYHGDGCENILVNFLSEVVFLMQNRQKLTHAVRVINAGEMYLSAELLTVPSPSGAELEIKSVTYHNLKVEDQNGVKTASIVFDI